MYVHTYYFPELMQLVSGRLIFLSIALAYICSYVHIAPNTSVTAGLQKPEAHTRGSSYVHISGVVHKRLALFRSHHAACFMIVYSDRQSCQQCNNPYGTRTEYTRVGFAFALHTLVSALNTPTCFSGPANTQGSKPCPPARPSVSIRRHTRNPRGRSTDDACDADCYGGWCADAR